MALVIPGTLLRATPPSHSINRHSHSTEIAVTENQPIITNNPLLPHQIDPAGFYPDMLAVQKNPTIPPTGYVSLYSPADWQAFRDKFGDKADAIGKQKSSGQLDFARELIAAAKDPATRPGLKRLLLVRATAIAYRHREGTPVAADAIQTYQRYMDLSIPADVAALWTMADSMTRYATTPKPDRTKFSLLAAKANIQLSVLLLDAGQIDAAQKVVKMLTRHDVAIRNDATLHPLANKTKTLVSETAIMMDRLAIQWQKIAQPPANGARLDNTAVVELYLYARYIAHQPNLMNELILRRGTSALGLLHDTLEKAKTDPQMMYNAGDSLKKVAETLPEGVLKHRVLYAAWQQYDAFANNPSTQDERIKRTLAGITKQGVIGDGAHGTPIIHPFESTPPTETSTTLPVTTAPATQPTNTPVGTPSGHTSTAHHSGAPSPHRTLPTPAVPHTPAPAKPDPTIDGTPTHPVG